jgi:zinc/manganese transport system substrate-binding protein
MKVAIGLRLILTSATALCASLATAPALAFTVFACEPEWAALVRSLVPAAALACVHVATHAGQDPHHIEARPALIAQVRSADLLVCTGAGLEDGWLPVLQQRAGNAKAQDVFFAAAHVPLLDARPGAAASPWSGDVHAEGNPHLHTDPERLLAVSRALAQRLQRELPAQAAAIEQRHEAFSRRWAAALQRWQRQTQALRGQRIASQHATFGYLWRWLGVTVAADLEPLPGMASTPGHLQRVLQTLRGPGGTPTVHAVVIASFQDPRPARWLVGQLGAGVPLLVLPATVAEDADGPALVAWMDTLLNSLTAAAAPPGAPTR